jgi:hypothetical protein
MTNENKEILNNLLTEWFNDLNKIEISKHFWSENSTGTILKNRLKELSHWKNKSKGRKGNLIQLELARKVREEKKAKLVQEGKEKQLKKTLLDF